MDMLITLDCDIHIVHKYQIIVLFLNMRGDPKKLHLFILKIVYLFLRG